MKRVVVLLGQRSSALTETLLYSACAGMMPGESLTVLQCEPTGNRRAQVDRLTEAYGRIQSTLGDQPFETAMEIVRWGDTLPYGAKTLRDWTQEHTKDDLLCRAMFPEADADAELLTSLGSRPDLARVAFAALLEQAENDEKDPFARVAQSILTALDKGEEARVVLAGSLCDGVCAAGVEVLSAYYQERFGLREGFRLGAVLLLPCFTEDRPAMARDALTALHRAGTLQTVCLVGLRESTRMDEMSEEARLTDWLGVYCMDVLLNRPQWLTGSFTVQAGENGADWTIFGKMAERYRRGYGRLIKASAAWMGYFGPSIERRLAHPNFLRDGFFGWYPRYFKKSGSRAELLEDTRALSTLSQGALKWISGIVRGLPIEMRYSSAISQAWEEGRAHYEEYIHLVGQKALDEQDERQTRMVTEETVYRDGEPEEAEEEAAARLRRTLKDLEGRAAVQNSLNRRMGGANALELTIDALEKVDAEASRLRRDHDEALRRIEKAETLVTAKDRYRIDDARTKLKRMERHQVMVEAMCEQLREDVAAMRRGEARFLRPALVAQTPENGFFQQEMMDRLRREEPLTRQEVADSFEEMVLPSRTAEFKAMRRALGKKGRKRRCAALRLYLRIMEASLKEEQA